LTAGRRACQSATATRPSKSLVAAVALLALLAAGLTACGSNDSSRSSAPVSAAAGHPTCDQFCHEAGPAGGPNPEACPAQGGICPPCPSQGCLDVPAGPATVSADGVASVRVRCRLSTPCAGALLILQPGKQTAPDAGQISPSEWVAGSNFRVDANRTAAVPVGMTEVGKRLVRPGGGYQGVLWILLKGHGPVPNTGPILLER
jgi:hypothetical protein